MFGGPTAYLFLLNGERHALQRRILRLDHGGVEAVVVLSGAGWGQPQAVRADDDDSRLNPFVKERHTKWMTIVFPFCDACRGRASDSMAGVGRGRGRRAAGVPASLGSSDVEAAVQESAVPPEIAAGGGASCQMYVRSVSVSHAASANSRRRLAADQVSQPMSPYSNR